MPRDIKSLGLDVTGFDDLDANLARLDAWAEKDVLKKSTKAGAAVVADEARKDAPQKSGRLSKAIRVVSGKSRKGSLSSLATIGKRYFQGDEFYGAFQEFGWRQGHRRLGKTRKAIAGKHFMENSYDDKKQDALDQMLFTMKTGLDQELAKK